MARLSLDDSIALLFLLVSGGALLFGDLILLVALPIALGAILLTRWLDDQGVIQLCGGIPLVIAVGYVSPFVLVVSGLLLITMTVGHGTLLSRQLPIGGAILAGGSVLALLLIPGGDPFRLMLLVLLMAAVLPGLLHLSEHALRQTVRGDDL